MSILLSILYMLNDRLKLFADFIGYLCIGVFHESTISTGFRLFLMLSISCTLNFGFLCPVRIEMQIKGILLAYKCLQEAAGAVTGARMKRH